MADQVEFFVKMNRLVQPSDRDMLLPVRFKPVFYDPNLADEKPVMEEDEEEPSIAPEVKPVGAEPSVDAQRFFRNPLHDPGTALSDEPEEEDVDGESFKFGRNMRASNGPFGVGQKKNVHELMNARMKLLQQQRDQQTLVDQEVLSDKAATALVNNLLLKGFNISGPEDAAHPQPFQLPPPEPTRTEGEEEIFPVEKEKLIGSIHKELKRVHGQAPEAP